MVVTLAWMHNWIAIAISLSVLAVIIPLLLFCLCWQRSSKNIQQLYVLDEDGMKRTGVVATDSPDVTPSRRGFFRRLSNVGLLKTHFRFASTLEKYADANYDKGNLIANEKELMDSLDVDREFNNAVLQIDAEDYLQVVDDEEDGAGSCASNDSKHTYYSIYPAMSRATSNAGTMRSACSYPEGLDSL